VDHSRDDTDILKRARRLTHRGLRRLREHLWTLVQIMLAATTAWLIAVHLAGHEDPFFAPIAAVSALSASLAERGLMALRLLLGVLLGISVGELASAALGGGYLALAIAIFCATALARILGSARIVVVQAGAGAILTVVAAAGDIGFHRLIDALIGAGVALVFSQMLFSPEPVALLRRAERLALADMADGLEMTARALERHVDAPAERAMRLLRQLRDRLTELGRVRRLSARSTRHSLVWRSRLSLLAVESAAASHLDLLGNSCLTLARSALLLDAPDRDRLVPCVRELARTLTDLAHGLDDKGVRQRAADRAFQVTQAFSAAATPPVAALAPALSALRMVAADIMVFAGVEFDEARTAVRKGTQGFQVVTPPPPVRVPLDLRKWRSWW
jgi:uncharacterized membrane protein YgaE (UPF0421/DUF939 family)